MKKRDYGSYIEEKCIVIVGEATKQIPDSIREKYPEIPWRDMAGIKDRLVHGYFKVNLEIVWITAAIEFPELRPTMQNVLADVDL
jgi:uncharacterized protein with HEPN domain